MRFCCETISFSVYSMSFMILRGTACAREAHVHDCWHASQERLGAPVKALRLDLQVFDGLRHCVFALGALVRPKDGGGQRTMSVKIGTRHGTASCIYFEQHLKTYRSDHISGALRIQTKLASGSCARPVLHPLSPLPGLVG